MYRIRCLGTSRTRPRAANQGERHRLALTAISLRVARLRAARTQQTLTLARCLRVGVDEFQALDKVAAVQLEGAPTFLKGSETPITFTQQPNHRSWHPKEQPLGTGRSTLRRTSVSLRRPPGSRGNEPVAGRDHRR
jgi:hypothetical protein